MNARIAIGSRSGRQTGKVLAVVAFIGLSWGAPTEAAEAVGEYQVKAGVILNLMKFIEWAKQPEPAGPIVVGVLGKDPFGTLLDRLEKESVKGRSVTVKRLPGWAQLAQGNDAERVAALRACSTLFVSASEKKSLPAILQSVRGHAVLTVGDMEGFVDGGGMINLLVDVDQNSDKKIRFEINLDATRESGLEVSSKLLRLAKRVVDQGKGAGAKKT
jgi:hypothetical protein